MNHEPPEQPSDSIQNDESPMAENEDEAERRDLKTANDDILRSLQIMSIQLHTSLNKEYPSSSTSTPFKTQNPQSDKLQIDGIHYHPSRNQSPKVPATRRTTFQHNYQHGPSQNFENATCTGKHKLDGYNPSLPNTKSGSLVGQPGMASPKSTATPCLATGDEVEDSIGDSSRFESCKDDGYPSLSENSTTVHTLVTPVPLQAPPKYHTLYPTKGEAVVEAPPELHSCVISVISDSQLEQPSLAEDASNSLEQKFGPQHPKEMVLHPSKLYKFPTRPLSSLIQDITTIPRDTPPPSYQECIASPYTPLPSTTTATTIPKTAEVAEATPTHPDTPTTALALLRVSNCPRSKYARSSRYGGTSSQSALIWHTCDDENRPRSSMPHDSGYSDHQLLALLACIMFWPLGLLAIYYANMANILRSEGINHKAVLYSKRALGLSLVAFLVGTGVYITFYFKR